MLHGDLNGKQVQGKGGTFIYVAGSFCCTAETNPTLENNYMPIKNGYYSKLCVTHSLFLFGERETKRNREKGGRERESPDGKMKIEASHFLP